MNQAGRGAAIGFAARAQPWLPLLLLLPLVAAAASLAGQQNDACPAPCQCHQGLLNCSRAALRAGHLPTGLRQLPPPGPTARNQTFFFLDFSGNSISSIEQRAWKGYPWAEYLVLKDNDLSKLQKDSLEGLLSLKHLDLSCNKIQFIEKHAFEPLPFLQFINLGGNLITELHGGTFQAWHGMQFLQKLVLSHNPLSVIADTSLFALPSLKYLDLGATQVTQKTFQTLLVTSLHLETLVLPDAMFCCLCQMKEDIEILCKTIKLHCEHSCAINSSLCGRFAVPEGTLEKMQEELMKVLQSRKLNASVVLNLEPEKPLLTKSENEITMLTISQYQPNTDVDFSKSRDLSDINFLFLKHLARKGEINNVGLTVLPFFKLFNINLHKGKVTPGLLKHPADQSNILALANLEHIDWANDSELRKLYILANLLAVELQEKIYHAEKASGANKVKPVLKSFLTTPTMHKSQAHGTEQQTPAVPRHLREHLKIRGICNKLAEQCDTILLRNKHGRKQIPERTKECVDYMVKCTRKGKKEKQSKKMKRETLQANLERSKGTVHCFSQKRRETKKAVKNQMQKHSDSNFHLVTQSRTKVTRSLKPSNTLPVFKHHKISIPSSRRHSLPNLPTQASHMAVSFKVNNSDDLTGKIIIFLEQANKTGRKKDLDAQKAKYTPTGQPKELLLFRKHSQKGSPHFSRNNHLFQKVFHQVNSDVSHVLEERKQKHRINSKEDVINSLSHRKSAALTDAVLENPSENKDSLLDGILPSIRQTNETHWKHQKESSDFPYALSGSSPPDNYSVQGDLFETELNDRLRSLIPNQAVRNLISHVIRTLKMDCTEPRVQLACAKLMSKTGLLMKLFSEREDIKETSSLWKTYLWENRNAPNESTHQRKADVKDSEEVPAQYSYGNKLLLAISVTVVIMIIIAVICLIEICSQRSAASSQSTHDNKPQPIWSFKKLPQEKKSKTSSEVVYQVPSVSEALDMEKPLWLRDMYLPLDSIRKKSMAQKLYDKESSDEEEIFNRADLRKQYDWSSGKESY